MESLLLSPIKNVQGQVLLPGSKSISNRMLLLAALAEGETRLENVLDSDDTRHMLNALNLLGVSVAWDASKRVAVIKGQGGCFSAEQSDLYLGNAGTAMRPLTAALCLGQGEYFLHGEPRMHERPIGDLVQALQNLGADIAYVEEKLYPPLKIKASGLRGGKVSIPGSISSQFLTALLLASPGAQETVEIAVEGELVSKPYIDITLDAMRRFGVVVQNDNYERFIVEPAVYQSPGVVQVEGDASAASYFLAAGAIGGGPVRVLGAGKESVQGDVAFAHVLEKMGAQVKWGDHWIEVQGGQELKGVDLDLNHIPDAAMTLGTLALFAHGKSCIRNVANWRVKETDRLYAMATELRKTGAIVEEGEDYICIEPPQEIQAATIDTYNDHRMAMCFSLLAFGSQAVRINDPGCTSKTYPEYFEDFLALSTADNEG
jgi:3-phosphoshikimate 1-carboxyvinyltransferase